MRHHLGRIMALIEILSPGNKDSRAAFETSSTKPSTFLRQGVHLLIVDFFPPSSPRSGRHPQGDLGRV